MLVRGAFARPWPVLIVILALMLASIGAATFLRIDTDSSRMLNPSLPFQERAQAINAAFPAVKNTILVVVRGTHADAVEAAVARLSAGIAARGAAVDSVFAPSADPFLLAHGLLYDDVDTLRDRLGRLSNASTLLAELRADQTVEGFLAALDRAMTLAEAGGSDPADLAPLMAEAATTFQAFAAGEARPLDWSGLLDTGSARVQRVITVKPVLDFTRLNAAKPALAAVGEEIAALDPDLAALVEIGVTGDPALRAEEV
ncbi:MAG: hypothetical protein AAFV96_08565, partial [Pseudomonadota bacterium]